MVTSRFIQRFCPAARRTPPARPGRGLPGCGLHWQPQACPRHCGVEAPRSGQHPRTLDRRRAWGAPPRASPARGVPLPPAGLAGGAAAKQAETLPVCRSGADGTIRAIRGCVWDRMRVVGVDGRECRGVKGDTWRAEGGTGEREALRQRPSCCPVGLHLKERKRSAVTRRV